MPRGEVDRLPRCAGRAGSDSPPQPQTQSRSKPRAEGLWRVFAKWKLQRARDTPQSLIQGHFSCN